MTTTDDPKPARKRAPRKPIPKKPERPRATRQRDADGFTPRDRAFVLHYMGAGRQIGVEAALLAGYGKGNRKSARETACVLLQKPHIQAEIERLRTLRNEKLQVTAEDVLRDLMILKVEAQLLPRNTQTIRAIREVIKDIGDHVQVGAFRKQLGLSNPTGGPIETVDLAALAKLSDEELDQLERANAIIDRISGGAAAVPDVGDTGGEGTAAEGE